MLFLLINGHDGQISLSPSLHHTHTHTHTHTPWHNKVVFFSCPRRVSFFSLERLVVWKRDPHPPFVFNALKTHTLIPSFTPVEQPLVYYRYDALWLPTVFRGRTNHIHLSIMAIPTRLAVPWPSLWCLTFHLSLFPSREGPQYAYWWRVVAVVVYQ